MRAVIQSPNILCSYILDYCVISLHATLLGISQCFDISQSGFESLVAQDLRKTRTIWIYTPTKLDPLSFTGWLRLHLVPNALRNVD